MKTAWLLPHGVVYTVSLIGQRWLPLTLTRICEMIDIQWPDCRMSKLGPNDIFLALQGGWELMIIRANKEKNIS